MVEQIVLGRNAVKHPADARLASVEQIRHPNETPNPVRISITAADA
jgi:hypothetical protein